MSNQTMKGSTAGGGATRYFVVVVLVVVAFFGAYRYALAKSSTSATGSTTTAAGKSAAGGFGSACSPGSGAGSGTSVASGGSGASGQAASGGGCACCGSSQPTKGGVTGSQDKAPANLSSGVQKVSVGVKDGAYSPNVIVLKAGVPAEITFEQNDGCTSQIVSSDLGFSVDVSAGPKTVKLAGLKKGEYSFSCSMQMVFGKVIVE